MDQGSEEYRRLLEQRQQMRRRRRRLRQMRQRAIEVGVLAVLVVLVGVGVWLLCRTPEEEPEVSANPVSENSAPIQTEPKQTPYPTPAEDMRTLGAELDAAYAVLVDVTDNRIVAEKGADTRVYPASVTKVLTLLVAVEHIEDYHATFTFHYSLINPLVEQEATRAGFASGECVPLTDLLYGAILPSGADATAALAQHVAGSEEAFVTLLNEKATALGLKDTHFTNSSGLHSQEHYTTATDMAVVLREAMANPLCHQVLTAKEYTTTATSQNPEGLSLYSTMFRRMYGTEPEGATIIGGKTGYTAQAGNTMASYALGEDGHDYIFVSMKGTSAANAAQDAFKAYSARCGQAVTTTKQP